MDVLLWRNRSMDVMLSKEFRVLFHVKTLAWDGSTALTPFCLNRIATMLHCNSSISIYFTSTVWFFYGLLHRSGFISLPSLKLDSRAWFLLGVGEDACGTQDGEPDPLFIEGRTHLRCAGFLFCYQIGRTIGSSSLWFFFSRKEQSGLCELN